MSSKPTSMTQPLLADDNKGKPIGLLVDGPHFHPSTYRFFVSDPEQGGCLASPSLENQTSLSNCIGENQSHDYYAFKYFVHARDERIWSGPSCSFQLHPGLLAYIVQYLDNIKADHQWARYCLEARIQGRPFMTWKDFERNRIANRKYPRFLCMYTIFSLIVLSVQLVLAGWENRDDLSFSKAMLVTSRIAEHGEWYRLLTSILLHQSFQVAFLNLLLLWVYGFFLERLHGSRMVASIFMVSLLGSALARATFTSYGGTISMSGGVCGLMGFSFASMWINWDIFPTDPCLHGFYRLVICGNRKYDHEYQSRLFAYFVVWSGVLLMEVPFVMAAYMNQCPFVSQSGFFYGFCFSLVFINPIGKEKKSDCEVIRHALLFALALFCYFGTFLFLLRSHGSESDLCPQCKLLACVDYPIYEMMGGSCDEYWTWNKKKAMSYYA